MLKIGDVVRLNSGSPRLTVIVEAHNGQYGSNDVTVSWIVAGKAQRTDFPETCFTKIGPEDNYNG
jgi:uncharacterized protein YodC (DUF2158 family)